MPMKTEFFSLGLSQDELHELHLAALARFIIETTLRQEQGLEAPPYPPLLEKIEQLLGMTSEEAHALLHQMETELWEFTWYGYTDEWAWFRAKQEVQKELGSLANKAKPSTVERLIERRYEEKFEQYVGEIDMKEKENATQPRERKRK